MLSPSNLPSTLSHYTYNLLHLNHNVFRDILVLCQTQHFPKVVYELGFGAFTIRLVVNHHMSGVI